MNEEQRRLLVDGMLTVSQAKQLCGLGRSKLYELMDRGDLPFAKIGRSRRIPKNALLSFIAKHLRGE
jgi:excisionase family DNA binding protein